MRRKRGNKKKAVINPMGKRAARRIKELAHELGEESNFKHGWKAQAARDLGLGYGTAQAIITGKTTSVGTQVINQVCKKIRCSTAVLMED